MIYSLFIGRWQPFHKGHKKLIESVLNEGKNVLVAIRDTEISKDDPFTIKQRKKMIHKSLKNWGDKVKIIVIPDISEVCYGRKVGWGIREIKLSDDIEEISGTKIRDNMDNRTI